MPMRLALGRPRDVLDAGTSAPAYEGQSLNNRQRLILIAASTTLVVVGLAACSSSTPSDAPSPTADSGPVDDGGTPVDAGTKPDADAESGADATPQPTFKTCTDAELDAIPLFTNGADVSFGATPAQYTNSCVRIKVGKDVEFAALSTTFEVHPLTGNGESGNPIPATSTGTTTGRITFPTAGTYSFHCTQHPSLMWGSIKVIP